MSENKLVTFSDNFEDDEASDWTVASGTTFAVIDGVMTWASGTPAGAFPTVAADPTQPNSPEQHIQATVVSTVEAGAYVSLLARCDTATALTATWGAASGSDGGYEMRLTYSASDVRLLEITRYNRSTGSREILGSVADATASTAKVSSSDLGVGQDIRFTVTTEETGVRLRAFINEEDDKVPTLSVLDLGLNTASSYTIKAAGYWGILMSATGVGFDLFEAHDKYIVPVEGPMIGRTLSQLRTALKTRVSRGGNTALADAYFDEQLNMAQQEIMNELGDLPLFMQREGVIQLASIDEGRTYELPIYVDRLISMRHTPTRISFRWDMVGYNNQNTGIVVASSENLDGRSVIITYYRAWSDLIEDDDRCAIPRRFDEIVVVSAAIRVAERAGDEKWTQHLIGSYTASMRRMVKFLNVMKRQQHSKLRVRSQRQGTLKKDTRYIHPSDLR